MLEENRLIDPGVLREKKNADSLSLGSYGGSAQRVLIVGRIGSIGDGHSRCSRDWVCRAARLDHTKLSR